MKKLLSAILPLLFIFISCNPEPGTLHGYEILFDNSNENIGVINIKISGTLESKYKNPVLSISIEGASKSISTDSYFLKGSSEHLTRYTNSKKTEYYICLEPDDIDYNIEIHMQKHGNYKLSCQIRAERTDKCDYGRYINYSTFTYE